MKRNSFEAVEAEIRREKAEALGRTGERLERILREIELIRRDLIPPTSGPRELNGAAQTSAGCQEDPEEHDRLWEQARYLRHCLIVQREAMGLRSHAEVDRQYPMPAPLALARAICREDGR